MYVRVTLESATWHGYRASVVVMGNEPTTFHTKNWRHGMCENYETTSNTRHLPNPEASTLIYTPAYFNDLQKQTIQKCYLLKCCEDQLNGISFVAGNSRNEISSAR